VRQPPAAGDGELEDPLVDRLAWRAMARGIGAVIARTPRAAIDCNRSADEIDPAVIADAASGAVGARARGGLGIVPSRCAPYGRLWRRPIDQAELERRIAEAHAPFHDAVALEIDRLVELHGRALLIDCHSMPRRKGQAEIIFGDRHGGSAAPWLAGQAARIARSNGWSAALNDPYAGGHVVERPAGRAQRSRYQISRPVCYPGRICSPHPVRQAARLVDTLVRPCGSWRCRRNRSR
jgi:N-formylglutamate amidohydrolase